MKKMLLALSFALALAVPSFVQADASPIPVASPMAAMASPGTPAAGIPVTKASVQDKLTSAVNAIPSELPGWLLAILAVLAELTMRFFPTKDPKSLFIVAGNLFGLVGSGLMKISKLLDSIVQNLQPKQPPTSPS